MNCEVISVPDSDMGMCPAQKSLREATINQYTKHRNQCT